MSDSGCSSLKRARSPPKALPSKIIGSFDLVSSGSHSYSIEQGKGRGRPVDPSLGGGALPLVVVGVGSVASSSPKVASVSMFKPPTPTTILLLSSRSGGEGHLAGLGDGV